MNIQDTIKELGLDNEKLPRILQQRVNTAQSLIEKVELAKAEHEKEPTEESEKSLNQVTEYSKEYFEDAIELLKSHKQKVNAKLEKAKAKEEAEKISEAKAEEKLDEVKKEAKTEDQPNVKKEEVAPKEESSSGGWGALLIGGVVLVATLGAVNILKNK